MFKLLTIIRPTTLATPTHRNSFMKFSVQMPSGLLPVLTKRLTTLLLYKLHGVTILHGITTQELIDLDTRLTTYDEPDGHNFILNGRQLSLIKRFLEIERQYIRAQRTNILTSLSNADYYDQLTDLSLSVASPTEVVNLSFLYSE